MATAAAAAVARARRVVLDHFFTQNAVVPEKSQPFEADSGLQRRQFERMRAAGVIREAKPGSYYVDVPTWHAWHSGLHRRALIIVFSVLLAGGVVLALVLSRG